LADDEGHEDCSRKSAVEKTSRASESLSRSMIDKWTGAESAMLFEDPLKSAGVAKVQQREHLVFFQQSAWSSKLQLQQALEAKGAKVLRLAVFLRQNEGKPDLRPMARAMVDSPLSREMLQMLKEGVLVDGERRWCVRRGNSQRIPNPRTSFLRVTKRPHDLAEFWGDAGEFLQALYAELCLKHGQGRQEDDVVLLRPSSWQGIIDHSWEVQVEVAQWAVIDDFQAALQEWADQLPLELTANHTANPCGQQNGVKEKPALLSVAGLHPQVVEKDLWDIFSLYGLVDKVQLHQPDGVDGYQSASVMMTKFRDGVRARMDLDGLDCEIGNLRVYPKMFRLQSTEAACASQGSACGPTQTCTYCGKGGHVGEMCPDPYLIPVIISDPRTGERKTLEGRCSLCFQLGCSIPCMWSAQWARIDGITVVSRVFAFEELTKPHLFDHMVPSLATTLDLRGPSVDDVALIPLTHA